MKHEIRQSYKSQDDITVITQGRRRPIRLDLQSLDEFVQAEELQLPSTFTVMIDERSPVQRIRQGDSFYNPQNTLWGKMREAFYAPVAGMASRRRATVQIQTWPVTFRAAEESVLKHELQHLGTNIAGGISPRDASLIMLGSGAYYFIEKAYPLFPGLKDNYVAAGIMAGMPIFYHITASERAAIKAQLRKLSKPLLIKE